MAKTADPMAAKSKRKTPATPMSESAVKLKSGTEEEVLADLRRIAEAEPEKVISRNYYRNQGRYAESAWNCFFGTFQEFKRQAGIQLSRHQHKVEREVAKHASKDALRELTAEKQGFEGKFKKPSGNRFQSILVVSDIHDKYCDPFYRRMTIEAAKRVKPDIICLNGDIFDLPEFSKWTNDPREWDAVGRIRWVHEYLKDLRNACPDAEMTLLEGNHEFRLLRHLGEATPALKAVLSDLHGMTVSRLLGLDEFGINYVARSDLTTFTERDIKSEIGKNWSTFCNDSVLGSHYPKDRDKGLPGWNGHHHKHKVDPGHSPIYGAYEWHQIGAGHMRAATYTDGEQWMNGFLLAHIDVERQRTQFDHVHIQDFCVLGGKWYERAESEKLHIDF